MQFACTIHFECKSKVQPCCECIVIGSRVTNPIIVFPACDLHQHFSSTCLRDPRRHQAQCFAACSLEHSRYFYCYTWWYSHLILFCWSVIGTGVTASLHCMRIVNNGNNNNRSMLVIQAPCCSRLTAA